MDNGLISPIVADQVLAHGTKLYYYRTGGNKPVLRLEYGISDDGLSWTPVAEMLAALVIEYYSIIFAPNQFQIL